MKRISLFLLTVTLSITYLSAQPPWTNSNIRLAPPWHLAPYVPPTTPPAAGSLEKAQQLVSHSVVFLTNQNIQVANSINSTMVGGASGYLIQTDPTLDYVCMVTAGHNITGFFKSPSAEATLSLDMAYNYVNHGPERYNPGSGQDYSNPFRYDLNNLKADWATNVPVVLAGWVDSRTHDWALLKIPKMAFPQGAQVYQLPVVFSNVAPADIVSDLFLIHHAYGQPQRLSLLPKNEYTRIDDLYNNTQWMISRFSEGGLAGGASGAPLIQFTQGGGFSAIGTHIASLTHSSQTLADYDRWVGISYKLTNIQTQILTHCGPQTGAISTTTQIPNPIPVFKSEQSFTTQAALTDAARSQSLPYFGTSSFFDSWGSIVLSAFTFTNQKLFVFAQEGEITLGEGFSIQADATTMLHLGLTGSVSARAPAARKAATSSLTTPVDQRFVIYPNPAQTRLTVRPEAEPGGYRIRILDQLGRTRFEETGFQSGSRQIDLVEKGLQTGSYLIQIQLREGKPFSTNLLIR